MITRKGPGLQQCGSSAANDASCLSPCQRLEEDPDRTNIDLRAGAGGLHSGEN
jgi:hypothetical protein